MIGTHELIYGVILLFFCCVAVLFIGLGLGFVYVADNIFRPKEKEKIELDLQEAYNKATADLNEAGGADGQKWEYLTIETAYVEGETKPSLINENKIKDWRKGPIMFDYMKKLGNDGWELVTQESYEYIFKRPKE